MHRTGGPEVLQYKTNFPVPVPGNGEVLIQNEFIGINYVDMSVHLSRSSLPDHKNF
jgi:NADPH2:quinone reductase